MQTDPGFTSPVQPVIVNVGGSPTSALAPVPSLREGFSGGGFQLTKTANITDRDIASTFVVKVEEQIRTQLVNARNRLTEFSKLMQKAHDARASWLRTAFPSLVPYITPSGVASTIPNSPSDPGFIWDYSTVRAFEDAVSLCRRFDADTAIVFSDLSYDPSSNRIAGTISVEGSRSDRSSSPRSGPGSSYSCDFTLNYRADAPAALVELNNILAELSAEVETINKEIAGLRNALGNVDFLERRARAGLTEAALQQDDEASKILEKLSDKSQIDAALGYLSAI